METKSVTKPITHHRKKEKRHNTLTIQESEALATEHTAEFSSNIYAKESEVDPVTLRTSRDNLVVL